MDAGSSTDAPVSGTSTYTARRSGPTLEEQRPTGAQREAGGRWYSPEEFLALQDGRMPEMRIPPTMDEIRFRGVAIPHNSEHFHIPLAVNNTGPSELMDSLTAFHALGLRVLNGIITGRLRTGALKTDQQLTVNSQS